ncbi:MAG: transporter substrate-binding domain-containing protein, partial [Anaerolineae bacterium]
MKLAAKLTTIALLLLLGLIAASCGPAAAPAPTAAPPEQPTAMPEASTPAPEAPTDTPVPQDDWARVQQTGQLVVATSADYPPFEYYTSDFQLEGFDIALMRQIGQRLGVQVVFKDFAFDGLMGALQLKQIDAAIAAITITEERAEVVDFSDTYYVGEESVLARADSPIAQVTGAEDAAGKTVGVQSGSVYESWAETNLVEPGIIPAENLLSFGDVEQAIASLRDGRIDLVLIDRKPAQAFIAEGGLKEVGHGISRQQFGIAVEKGSTLTAQFNRVLAELKDENVIADLAQQYLDLSAEDVMVETPAPPTATPVPATATPTPEPAATPVPPTATPVPPCIDGMAWVQDLNYDDRNMTAPPVLAPGQSFVKSWRVRNSGTCDWTPAFTLTYVSGNVPGAQMGGAPQAVQGQVQPGQTYDFNLPLVAPQNAGVYQGFWQMRNAQGMAFGERIWVGIQVPGAPTPTPFPTPTPAPGISFSANRTHIKAGESVVFTWRVENVKAVYFYADGENWQNNGVAGEASQTVYPPQTTNYNLRVVKPDDSVEVRQIRIEVDQVANAPVIGEFNVSPDRISLGQCVQMRWNVYGDVSQVTVGRDSLIIWKGAPLSTQIEDCPEKAGKNIYWV